MKAQKKLMLAGAVLLLAGCVHIPPEVVAEFEGASERNANHYLPPAAPVPAARAEDAVR
jgi:starvation-inducible outer membrane lipoprotein